MGEQVRETVQGDGWAVGSLDGMGDGPGFRKVRRELGVEAFGANAIVIPSGYETPLHYHEEQDELYFIHQGTFEIELGPNGEEKFTLGPGGLAHVAAHTVRRLRNVGDGDGVYFCVGGKGGYVGRDGRNPGGDEMTRPGR